MKAKYILQTTENVSQVFIIRCNRYHVLDGREETALWYRS